MLETERLKIRKFTRDDLPWLIEMRMQPEVSKYLGGERLQNPEMIEKRLNAYFDSYEKLGFGVGAMSLKETGETVGFSGLQPLEDTGEIEVGYSMYPKFWRKGFGFECAHAWLKYGFETVGLERVVACADKKNTGSWRIMEKCGMKYEGIQEHHGMPLVVYAISKSEFLRSNT
jgi:ribosomal-protein-alanine N-acetyltransferase